MFQPYQEKYHIFKVGDQIRVDNKIFTIKLIELKRASDDIEQISITLWGNKPNAVTSASGGVWSKGYGFTLCFGSKILIASYLKAYII